MSKKPETIIGALGLAALIGSGYSDMDNSFRYHDVVAEGIQPLRGLTARVLGYDVIKKCECVPFENSPVNVELKPDKVCFDGHTQGENKCTELLVAKTRNRPSIPMSEYHKPEIVQEVIAAQVNDVFLTIGGVSAMMYGFALPFRRKIREALKLKELEEKLKKIQ